MTPSTALPGSNVISLHTHRISAQPAPRTVAPPSVLTRPDEPGSSPAACDSNNKVADLLLALEAHPAFAPRISLLIADDGTATVCVLVGNRLHCLIPDEAELAARVLWADPQPGFAVTARLLQDRASAARHACGLPPHPEWQAARQRRQEALEASGLATDGHRSPKQSDTASRLVWLFGAAGLLAWAALLWASLV